MRWPSLRIFTVTALVVAGLFSAGAAKADSTMLYFTLTGPVDATFELSSNPFVDPGNADPGFGFLMTPTDLTINGVASSDVLAFYNTAGGGGFAAFDSNWNPDFSLYGAVLYGGKEWKPKFGPSNGTIELADEDGVPYSLTITKVATPEPGSLLLLLAGLLPLGLLAKRR